jgi:uncharacterized membrane protein
VGLRAWSERLGDVEALDAGAAVLEGALRPLRSTALWRVLRGRWLGHPVHPMLTDVPIGLWTGAVTLDLLGGRRFRSSADLLIGLGAVAALPTAAAGAADWAEASRPARRQGLVHALTNSVALLGFLASLAVRPLDRSRGRRLALLAYTALLAGAYLGGHLTYVEGVGVDRRAAREPAGPPAPGVAG